MSRPFTYAQARENALFLEVLAQTGNARLAAREVRRAHSTMFERRSKHAAFAQGWDAAVAAAHARFHLSGGKRGPEADVRAEARRNGPATHSRSSRAKSRGAGTDSSHTPLDCARDERKGSRPLGFSLNDGTEKKRDPRFCGDDGALRQAQDERGLRTKGGEAVVVRTKTGKLQLRLAHPGKLTKQCEQAFLLALSATANIRLSAAAAGASPAAFYRRRERDPAFAREMRLALKMGYERLEMAAYTAGLAGSHADDQWRNCEPPPIPPMSVSQAIQLLYLHEKSVRQRLEAPHRRRRRGEPWEVYTERVRAMWRAEKGREAEEAALRRAARYETSGDWRFAEEQPPPPLPPLHLVTGWSRADPKKAPHDAKRALFGGWRTLPHQSGTLVGARKK